MCTLSLRALVVSSLAVASAAQLKELPRPEPLSSSSAPLVTTPMTRHGSRTSEPTGVPDVITSATLEKRQRGGFLDLDFSTPPWLKESSEELSPGPSSEPSSVPSSEPLSAILPAEPTLSKSSTSSAPSAKSSAAPAAASSALVTQSAAIPAAQPTTTGTSTTNLKKLPATSLPTNSAVPSTTVIPARPTSSPEKSESVTTSTQWVETKIVDPARPTSTSSTWVPVTLTMTFKLLGETAAPAPGKGEIGLGSLTEQPKTTTSLAQGAAETNAPAVLGLGLVAGVLGIAGMV